MKGKRGFTGKWTLRNASGLRHGLVFRAQAVKDFFRWNAWVAVDTRFTPPPRKKDISCS
jgi:hypothetical protein